MSVHKLKLKANHTWRSKPGYSICVLDRGAVRFDYPSNWKVDMAEGAVYLHDREPSIESCDLGVSIFRVPMESSAELPMEEMLTHSIGSDRVPYEQSEIRWVVRGDLEVVWVEQRYIEKTQNRDARFRAAIARGPLVALITMNYWSSPRGGIRARVGRGAEDIATRPVRAGPDGGAGCALTAQGCLPSPLLKVLSTFVGACR